VIGPAKATRRDAAAFSQLPHEHAVLLSRDAHVLEMVSFATAQLVRLGSGNGEPRGNDADLWPTNQTTAVDNA
jgi:hypothetical protein